MHGLIGLVGSRSRLFFLLLLTIRTMQVLVGCQSVRYLVENAGSMKDVHFVAFCRPFLMTRSTGIFGTWSGILPLLLGKEISSGTQLIMNQLTISNRGRGMTLVPCCLLEEGLFHLPHCCAPERCLSTESFMPLGPCINRMP